MARSNEEQRTLDLSIVKTQLWIALALLLVIAVSLVAIATGSATLSVEASA